MTKELALSLIEGKDVIYLTEEGRKMIEAILNEVNNDVQTDGTLR
ncbi:hypothetical protein [Metabacillus sp. Hm71]